MEIARVEVAGTDLHATGTQIVMRVA